MWNLKTTRVRIATISLAAALALISAPAHGQTPAPPAADEPQPAPLPDVPLAGRNGAAVPGAAAFPSTGRWLLVIVRPNCAPCDALLARIQGDAWSPAIPRLVIVTSGANAAEAHRLATANPALDAAAWYADEAGGLAAALQIQESPMVLAIHDRGIQWTLSGVLSGSKRMQDVLTAWVKNPAAPRTPSAAAMR
jgi:hypothetical protein